MHHLVLAQQYKVVGECNGRGSLRPVSCLPQTFGIRHVVEHVVGDVERFYGHEGTEYRPVVAAALGCLVYLAFLYFDACDSHVGPGEPCLALVAVEAEYRAGLAVDVAPCQRDGVGKEVASVVNEVAAGSYKVEIAEEDRHALAFLCRWCIGRPLKCQLQLRHIVEIGLVAADDELSFGHGWLQLANVDKSASVPVADDFVSVAFHAGANEIERVLKFRGVGHLFRPAFGKRCSRCHGHGSQS